jgi:hypothetical protein
MSREPRAFPRSADSETARGSDGMTLRDYYAGRAMQAMLGEMVTAVAREDIELPVALERTARLSFAVADAMMKARG